MVNAQGYPAGLRAPPPLIDPSTGLPLASEIIVLDASTHIKRLNLNLEGFPFAEVIEMLRKEYTNINFIVTPSVRDYSEPVFLKLRLAGLQEILTGIYFATDRQIEYEVQSPTLLAFVSAKDKPPAGVPAPSGASAPAVKPAQPTTYQILNLREVLRVKDPAKIDEILKTVSEITKRTLLELHDGPGATPDQAAQLMPRLNYHPGSGVLVIIGQQAALEIANQVIRNLRMPGEERGASGAPYEPARKPAPPTEPVPPKAPTTATPAKPESATP